MLQETKEYFKRLIAQPDSQAIPAQLSDTRVGLKGAEAKEFRERFRPGHRYLTILPAEFGIKTLEIRLLGGKNRSTKKQDSPG